MGQAFDERGNVLGEATGESAREVFDKLSSEFKSAAEFRIKSIVERHEEAQRQPTNQGDGATSEEQQKEEPTGAPV